MKKGYGYIFWGFIIIILDVNIIIDLANDLIGWIMIWYGLGKLVKEESSFKRGKDTTVVIISIEIGRMILLTFGANNLFTNMYISSIMTILMVLLELVLFQSIFEGIYKVSDKLCKDNLKSKSNHLWKLMFISKMLFLIVSAFSINFSNSDIVELVGGLLMLFIFVLYFMILLFIRKAGREFYVVK